MRGITVEMFFGHPESLAKFIMSDKAAIHVKPSSKGPMSGSLADVADQDLFFAEASEDITAMSSGVRTGKPTAALPIFVTVSCERCAKLSAGCNVLRLFCVMYKICMRRLVQARLRF